jgi:N-acetylmuramoyl-L-alanine amidase
VVTDEQTGCGHRTACRYANPKHPACEATPAMKPRPARAKTPRARKEPNTDRGLNERVTREKPDRESPPNSKKRRVHLCSCSQVRRPRSLRGNTASRGGIIDPGHSGSDAGSRRNIHHSNCRARLCFSSLIGPVCGTSGRRKRIHRTL